MSNATEELKGLIKEVCGESIKQGNEALQKMHSDWQKEFEKKSVSEQKEILARIEKIESAPLVKRAIEIPGTNRTTEVYLGVKMQKQMQDIFTGQRFKGHQEAILNPKLFPVIASEEKREKYAKFILMAMKCSLPNMQGHGEAVKEYHKFMEEHKTEMAEGVGSTGGFVVPDEFSDEILAFSRLSSFALRDCRIWPMGSDVRRVPNESASVSVAITGEGSAATESEPTMGETVLTANKIDAFSIASNELLEDASVDIVSYLTEIFAEATGQKLDSIVLNATGSPCSGVLTAAAGFSVVMGTGSAHFSMITGQELLDMIDRIPLQAEAGAKFYMHKTILTYLRKLRDTTGQYIFSPMAGGLPRDLWAYPYELTAAAPGRTESAASKAFVVFGNMRYFALGRRTNSMQLSLDPYGLFTKNQTRFRLVQRWGTQIGLANAFCRLLTSA